MSYSNKSELLALMQEYGLQAQKSFSQNFLIDRNVLQKMIDVANVTSQDAVVEVGPGLGVLTQELLARAESVRAIELDAKLTPILEKRFGHHPHFTLEKGNALKAKLPTYPYKVIANLPYAITSPLLNHFLQPRQPEEKRPTHLVVMVQKEVAEKICAIEPHHSILSLQVQIFGKPRIISKVSKHAFYPQPKVDSAVIEIKVYDQPLIQNTELFFILIKKAFSGKRKTLVNSLEGLRLPATKEQQILLTKIFITELLCQTDISPQARAQELSISQWSKIIHALS